MNTAALTWLARQLAWEASLSALREVGTTDPQQIETAKAA
jgi:hypothetical protein